MVRKDNNFNLLRLGFAILVVLSHAFEFIDGDRHREILTRIFHTLSFGELAVDGFFLLSGYLIVQSWLRTPDFPDFFLKRVLRIYPGFIAATLLCAFIVGPLAANPTEYFSRFDWTGFIRDMLMLRIPNIPPVFQGTHYGIVNGALWTISYEFRCYSIVAVLGICGVLRRPALWLGLTTASLVLYLFPPVVTHVYAHCTAILRGGFDVVFGDPVEMARFFAFFGSGACFFLFRDRIRFARSFALVAGVVLLPLMFNLRLQKVGLVFFGAYLLFAFAFAQTPRLAKLRRVPDISYGVYLYAWPIEKLLLWYVPTFNPVLIFLVTTLLSCVMGWFSWHLIESNFLKLKPKGKTLVVAAAVQ